MPEMVRSVVVLPAPLAPTMRDQLPLAHLQGDAFYRLDGAVEDADVVQRQHGQAPATAAGSSAPR